MFKYMIVRLLEEPSPDKPSFVDVDSYIEAVEVFLHQVVVDGSAPAVFKTDVDA